MIHDAQGLFSDAQAVTAAAASTNYVDLLTTYANTGTGENLYLVVSCDVAMTDSGSDSTLAVALEQDDNSSFSSATALQTIGTFAATSAAGTTKIARIAPGVITERYVRLYFTPANGNLTTGSFTAFITYDVDSWRAYAKSDGAVIDLT